LGRTQMWSFTTEGLLAICPMVEKRVAVVEHVLEKIL